MKLSKYTIFHKQNDNVYIYNQISMALLEIDNELYDILKQGDMNIVHNDVMKVLRDNGFIVNNNVNESDKICYANMKNRYNSKFMRITILPTLNCNFKCWYCYEQHKVSSLSEKNAESILTFIKYEVESRHIETVALDWFGGESLMRFKQTVYPLSEKLMEWCIKRDIHFINMITTNGSLIDEKMARRMNDINLRQFQITLDGGKEMHNKVKFSSLMKNSYDVIIKNIHTLCRNIDDVNIELRINYTHDNIDSALEVLTSFDDDIKCHILISPHIVWQESKYAEGLLEKVDLLKEKAFEMGFSVRNSDLQPRCTACYTDNMEQFVINYDLNVYKCTARDFDKKNSIGKIDDDGNFLPNDLYYKFYITSSPFMRERCLDCNLLPTCLYSSSCLQKKIEGYRPECNKEAVMASLKKSLSLKIKRL